MHTINSTLGMHPRHCSCNSCSQLPPEALLLLHKTRVFGTLTCATTTTAAMPACFCAFHSINNAMLIASMQGFASGMPTGQHTLVPRYHLVPLPGGLKTRFSSMPLQSVTAVHCDALHTLCLPSPHNHEPKRHSIK